MKKVSLLLSLILLCLWACTTKHEKLIVVTGQEAPSEETIIGAVCIWDQLSVRQEANEKSKWLTSVSLGEKVIFLNESIVDSVSKKQYVKIKLSDNTEGWSLAEFMVTNGRPAVFLGETEFYKRPDLMTRSGSSFKAMDIVAIASEQDGWYEVKGKRADGKYISAGWIKPENVSLKDADIAVAKYAATAMSKNGEEKLKALKGIIENADFSGSYFIPVLRKEVMDMEVQMKKENSIEDEVDTKLAETVI
jgi:hypothetical protein